MAKAYVAEIDQDDIFLALLIEDQDENWELILMDHGLEESEAQTFYSMDEAREWVDSEYNVDEWEMLPAGIQQGQVMDFLEDRYGSAV